MTTVIMSLIHDTMTSLRASVIKQSLLLPPCCQSNSNVRANLLPEPPSPPPLAAILCGSKVTVHNYWNPFVIVSYVAVYGFV